MHMQCSFNHYLYVEWHMLWIPPCARPLKKNVDMFVHEL